MAKTTKTSHVSEPKPKSTRKFLGIRASDDEAEIITRAAEASHRTRNGFVMHYALRAAKQILTDNATDK
jgi:uncharacterized protein (DUF1778 family)